MDYRKCALGLFCTVLLIGTFFAACDGGSGRAGLARCTIGEHLSKDDVQGNAGCLIKIDDRLVLIDVGSGISPPGGTPRVVDKRKESAWQTACRETQEEFWVTPIKVEKLLHNFGDFYLFHCTLNAETANNFAKVKSLTKWDIDADITDDIKVVLKDPRKIPAKAWRFPEHRSVIIDLFKKLRTTEGQ